MTETGQVSYGLADPDSYVAGWSGWVISSVETRIDPGPEGGERGRLFMRISPEQRAEGYFGGDPIYDAEGWFDTGDLARMTADGQLFIEGRADNVINLGGSKLAAELIEMLVEQCPGVVMSAAVGLNPKGGMSQELGIAVVAGPGFGEGQVEVMIAARLKIRAKIHVVTCADLPRLPSGKLDRRALPALFG
jgi:fatty-acyl-CoA synthase